MKKRERFYLETELRLLSKEIAEERARWIEINEGKSWDPSWPDGVNMNLIRRHIIHNLARAAEICIENGIPMPEECLLPIPPEVSDAYMANPERKVLMPCVPNAAMTQKAVYEYKVPIAAHG